MVKLGYKRLEYSFYLKKKSKQNSVSKPTFMIQSLCYIYVST